MKTLRWILPALALAALGSGCLLLTGQFIVSYELPDPVTITSPLALEHADVDLNTNSDYTDHKSELKDVADIAILGEFANTGAVPVDVEVWMTPEFTNALTDTDVKNAAGAVRVWGPLRLAVGQTLKVGWNQSAGLFKGGKQALIGQVKGDGKFSLYALGASGNYQFRIHDGVLVAVIHAGK